MHGFRPVTGKRLGSGLAQAVAGGVERLLLLIAYDLARPALPAGCVD